MDNHCADYHNLMFYCLLVQVQQLPSTLCRLPVRPSLVTSNSALQKLKKTSHLQIQSSLQTSLLQTAISTAVEQVNFRWHANAATQYHDTFNEASGTSADDSSEWACWSSSDEEDVMEAAATSQCMFTLSTAALLLGANQMGVLEHIRNILAQYVKDIKNCYWYYNSDNVCLARFFGMLATCGKLTRHE